MKHPRTTIGGWFLIGGAVVTFCGQWLATGDVPPMGMWQAAFTGIVAGITAIMAADGNKS